MLQVSPWSAESVCGFRACTVGGSDERALVEEWRLQSQPRDEESACVDQGVRNVRVWKGNKHECGLEWTGVCDGEHLGIVVQD